jgi:molybdenum cofactor cytidylyltransferase
MKPRSLPALRIVVLAAGFSIRLGHPKALARVRGRTLLRRTLDVLAPFAKDPIIVVTPPAASRYKIASSAHSVTFAANPRRAAGLSSSVRLALRRARHSAGVLLLPVDLVELTSRDVGRLISRWRGARRRVVARRVPGGTGVPLIWPHWLYACASGLQGDRGLRALVQGLPQDAVSPVVLPSAELDVDTAQDLERARRRRRAAQPRRPEVFT